MTHSFLLTRFALRSAFVLIGTFVLLVHMTRAVGATRWLDAGVLIYVSECGSSSGIYSMDVGRLLIVPLTHDDYADISRSPEWSPDGQRITFFMRSGFYVMDADGHNAHSLDGGLAIIEPNWTPDSQQILFLTFDSNNMLIAYRMNRDGSELTLYPAYEPTLNGESTMGERNVDGVAASVQYRRGQGTELYVRDGEGERRMTQNQCVERSPRWQP